VVGGAILLVALSVFGFDFDSVGRRVPDDAEPVGKRESDGGPDEG
jgi:signal peptidase II